MAGGIGGEIGKKSDNLRHFSIATFIQHTTVTYYAIRYNTFSKESGGVLCMFMAIEAQGLQCVLRTLPRSGMVGLYQRRFQGERGLELLL